MRKPGQHYASLDRHKLEKAGGVKIDDRHTDHMSALVELYLRDVAADFEPPEVWGWSREAPLTREMEQKRRDWLVREVEKIWRDCGGTGSGAYFKSETTPGQYTGPLIELLVELLDQADAPFENRSRHSLFRSIKNKDKATGRRR